MGTDRREFLKRTAVAAVTGAAVPLDSPTASGAQGQAPSQPQSRAFDRRVLDALAETVLPERLGAEGRRAATLAFVEWARAYRPVMEEMHGYGHAEITFTPADPAPGWDAQLQALDLLAIRSVGMSFDRLDVARRRAVVVAALERVTGSRVPSSPLTAPHVALALLAHWASSSEAHDLAYGVRIGRGTCRPLAETTRRPLPLAPER
jgi:hypothetical protein